MAKREAQKSFREDIAPYLTSWHWTVWIMATMYALWRFTSNRLTRSLPELDPSSFSNGMFGIGRKRDSTDGEWNVMSDAYQSFYLMVLLQPLLTQAFLHKYRHLLPYFYTAYSTLFLLLNLGWPTTLLYYGVHASMFLAALSRSVVLCFLLLVAIILHIHDVILPTDFRGLYERYGETVEVLTDIALCWVGARALSFALDFIHEPPREGSCPDFWKTLGYVLYLPSLLTGPLINYVDFERQLAGQQPSWTWNRLGEHLWDLFRCLVYYLGYTLVTHWFYSSAMASYSNAVAALDCWSQAGLAFGLVLMFYLKYRVLYGVPTALAAMEGIRLPTYPKCVGHIHLCSYVWKNFDRGLHLWLLRYVYLPVVGNSWTVKRRVVAAGACFALVWIWHGTGWNIAMWCSLNLMGMTLEYCAAALRETSPFRHVREKWPVWNEVWAAVAAPYYLFSLFSSMFFLASREVAQVLLNSLILGFPLPLLPLLFVLYCGCHVSNDIMSWEKAQREQP